MTGIIFINYRRADAANAAGRLYERLDAHYGADRLFMDIDKIAGGVDFVTELDKTVAETDVLLAVIGANWLTIENQETGSRRLDSSADYVRIEIEKAIGRDLEIIPVLVDGAAMPRPEDLPETLKPLARRNAMRLTHERFRADAQGLINSIDQAFERISEHRKATERQTQVEEDRRKAEEARRLAEEEERRREEARLKAAAGLSAEQITAAEAVANWEFIKESTDPKDFRNHLARYLDHEASVTWARNRLDELVWQALGADPDMAALTSYLDELPRGKYAAEAHQRLAALKKAEAEDKAEEEKRAREAAAWEAVTATTDPDTFKAFLRDHPSGAHAAEARRLQRALSGGGSWRHRGLGWAVVAMVACVLAVASYFVIPESTRGYWAAQWRIAEAARSGSKTLDLEGLQLEQLPPELFNLTQLTSLNLAYNELMALPPELFQLTELTSLDLALNDLTTLLPDIGRLTQLTSLNLGYNELTTLPPDIGRITQLTSLDLGYNKLTTLPPEIGRLAQLTSLDLRYNKLTTLPPDIGRLTQLTSLDPYANPWKPPFDALVEKGSDAMLDYLAKLAKREANGGEQAKQEAERRAWGVPLPKVPEGSPFEEIIEDFFKKSGGDSVPLGLTLNPLTDELRNKYRIGRNVKGVVVTAVDPDSTAAKKNIEEGNIITEITGNPVSKPSDVAKRIDEVRRSGRSAVLLQIKDQNGEIRFVAVPFK